MATLLRIKRKSSIEPTEALVIASKRARNETEVETVFKFIGTVKENEEHNGGHIVDIIKKHKSLKERWGKSPKIRNSDFRAANRNYSDKRLKLLNSYRNIPEDIEEETKHISNPSCSKSSQEPKANEDLKTVFQCYDVFDEEEENSTVECVQERITCNGMPLLKSEEIEYVYDLYYSPDTDFDSHAIENVVSIKGCTLENDLVFPDDDADSECFDDDDSNDEDNWRNDYPEEDPSFEKNLDYFRDYDEIEEEFLDRIRDCDIASDEYCSDDDNDFSGSNSFDHNYAKYKTKVVQNLDNDE